VASAISPGRLSQFLVTAKSHYLSQLWHRATAKPSSVERSFFTPEELRPAWFQITWWIKGIFFAPHLSSIFAAAGAVT
jgi:hypothetical protein